MNGTSQNISKHATLVDISTLETLIPLYTGLSSTALYVTFFCALLFFARKHTAKWLSNLSCTVRWRPPASESHLNEKVIHL